MPLKHYEQGMQSIAWCRVFQYHKHKQCMRAKSLSHVQLFVTLWTVALQAPLSMGFSRKNTEVGCHALLQGIFPTQGLNPYLIHLHWQVDSLPLAPPGKPQYSLFNTISKNQYYLTKRLSNHCQRHFFYFALNLC